MGVVHQFIYGHASIVYKAFVSIGVAQFGTLYQASIRIYAYTSSIIIVVGDLRSLRLKRLEHTLFKG